MATINGYNDQIFVTVAKLNEHTSLQKHMMDVYV